MNLLEYQKKGQQISTVPGIVGPGMIDLCGVNFCTAMHLLFRALLERVTFFLCKTASEIYSFEDW